MGEPEGYRKETLLLKDPCTNPILDSAQRPQFVKCQGLT